MYKLISVLLLSLLVCRLSAQELNIRVDVQSPQVQNTNKRSLEVLQKAITDFLNNRPWTPNKVQNEERIDGAMLITITSWDGSKEFKATAQIFSSRPVFGTNYNSPILAFNDRYFNFSYVEGDLLDYNENQYMSNLSSLLGFYANVIIGMDADSFKLNGGNPFFSVAKDIVNYSQNGDYVGWRSMDAFDNRYWLITNLTDRRYAPYREFSYYYHLKGLDKMSANETEARKMMADQLPRLKEVDRNNSGNILTSAFYAAKAKEFVGIFSKMPGNEGVKAYNLLVEVDPTNSTQYEEIRK
ncbi:type IX secretion system protein PorD [Sphingobacterium sp. SYP-B4668]|uniref:type IX secretion system protein PorD n=1 Tax=Sphingobacterium sp. SYP-B4668 TaxID=2996035 RepID=UPI0022DDAD0B|nr:DUF4835 family protein [Sphingobacterium sp. SYP-B4668]